MPYHAIQKRSSVVREQHSRFEKASFNVEARRQSLPALLAASYSVSAIVRCLTRQQYLLRLILIVFMFSIPTIPYHLVHSSKAVDNIRPHWVFCIENILNTVADSLNSAITVCTTAV